jgi:hypothetical protein
MNAKEVQQNIVKEDIKPHFKAQQFKVSGLTFYKQEKDFIKVFNIQSSAWNFQDDVRSTFNIGFFLPDTYEFWLQKPIPRNIKEYDCIFSIRPGTIINSGQSEYWYKINQDTNVEELRKDIRSHLIDYIFPFYNRYNSLIDLLNLTQIDNLSGNSIQVHIGLIVGKQGNAQSARELINSYLDLVKFPEDWINRIKNEAAQRGIKL